MFTLPHTDVGPESKEIDWGWTLPVLADPENELVSRAHGFTANIKQDSDESRLGVGLRTLIDVEALEQENRDSIAADQLRMTETEARTYTTALMGVRQKVAGGLLSRLSDFAREERFDAMVPEVALAAATEYETGSEDLNLTRQAVRLGITAGLRLAVVNGINRMVDERFSEGSAYDVTLILKRRMEMYRGILNGARITTEDSSQLLLFTRGSQTFPVGLVKQAEVAVY